MSKQITPISIKNRVFKINTLQEAFWKMVYNKEKIYSKTDNLFS